MRPIGSQTYSNQKTQHCMWKISAHMGLVRFCGWTLHHHEWYQRTCLTAAAENELYISRFPQIILGRSVRQHLVNHLFQCLFNSQIHLYVVCCSQVHLGQSMRQSLFNHLFQYSVTAADVIYSYIICSPRIVLVRFMRQPLVKHPV